MAFVINKENRDKGIALRTDILGPAHVQQALEREDDFLEYHHLFGHECSYAQVWSRNALSPTLRSMCVVGMAAALTPKSHTFKAHVLGAVRNGATRREVRQVLATISFYLGAGVGTDCIESARDALDGHLPALPREDDGAHLVSAEVLEERGRQVRRAVLGVEPCGKAPAGGAAAAYDHLKTSYYFGVLWNDPDLDPKSRVLVVISILLGANRRTMLATYLTAAKRLGWTREELDEVFLTAAIYCGAPAAEDGFAAAEECFSSPD